MIWKNWQKIPRKKFKNIQINIRKKDSQNSPIFLGGEKKNIFWRKEVYIWTERRFFSYENLKESVQPWPSRHTEQFFHLQSYLEKRIFTHTPYLGLYQSLPTSNIQWC